MDEVCGEFGPELREVMFGGEGLDETRWTQPALFAFEVASFRLLESWGVRADYLLGHSIGELAAAYVAGVWSLADACRVVGARGRLMQALPAGGAMAAVEASEDDVLPLLADGVSIAAVNGPTSVVVSGDESEVERITAFFTESGQRTRRLKVSHAFHSARMEGMLEDFRSVLESVEFHAPRLSVVSNVTGRMATAEELTSSAYWVSQVRSAVRFADGVGELGDRGVSRFVEVGPDGVLAAMVGELSDGSTAVPLARRDRDGERTALNALARLWVSGEGVDWARVIGGGRRVDLPTYAFQHRRYWPTAKKTAVGAEDDGGFWELVQGRDLAVLSAESGIDGEVLESVVPALSAWHRHELERRTLAAWQYRETWEPVTAPSATARRGTWLVVSVDGVDTAGMTDALDDVQTVSVPVGAGRDVVARVLSAAGAGGASFAGVVSLLALGCGDPVADTLALVQGLGDGGVGGSLWVVTR
ncbi:acyltransferase domain-containing protein, partial [Streptomyces sp. 150FB]|uniref:acyltransferase domain-containing protein n=1 Tax=Streptomyces sp. 150FB TaxID=1576605 RepID=UPI001364B705